MKKIALLSIAVVACAAFSTTNAAPKKKKTAAVEKTVVAPVELKSSSDSLSYAAGICMTQGLMPYLVQQLGVDTASMDDFYRGLNEMIEKGDDPKQKAYAAGMTIASQLRGQMVSRMKTEFTDTPDSIISNLVYRGFTDALKNDTTLMTMDKAQPLFREKGESNKKAKDEKLYGPNRTAGEQFLADNAKKDSVVTSPTGLQYKVLVKGTGAVPTKSDRVEVNYEGRLIDGTVFDSSSKHGSKPAVFSPSQVIKGWTEALTMMPVGSKWQLYIPYELAYGERNMGQIKPYSALVFDVELVGIENADKKAAATDASANSKEVKKTAKATKKAKSKK
jgi:FKBP-type peptidyl-prolyl cis-trans isomerase FklB